ncbi:blastula protease 10-like [Macrobrachium nipponense]|uniref:blastula protease 10-like n=1 Tax=Macrobrachium nipponense TaxID=159736 RepID=UPI0030C88B47
MSPIILLCFSLLSSTEGISGMEPDNSTNNLSMTSEAHTNLPSTLSTLQTNAELNLHTTGATEEGFPDNRSDDDLHNSNYKEERLFDVADEGEDSTTATEGKKDLSAHENEAAITPTTEETVSTDENKIYPSSTEAQEEISPAKEGPSPTGTRKRNENAEGWKQNTFYQTTGLFLINRTSVALRDGPVPCGETYQGSMHHLFDVLASEGTNETKGMSVLWPYGRSTEFPLVPYRILIQDPEIVKVIEESISVWKSATCINFVKVTPENESHLGTNETLDIGLHAYRCLYQFGKISGQSQKIFIHPSCAKKEGVVRGIGISLGLHYEFLRPDRDDYVKMNSQNLPKELPVYSNDEIGMLRGPYDYSSVMQPHGVWYTRDGMVTFATTDIRYQGILGRSGGRISHRDKVLINKLYGCIDEWRSCCGFRWNHCKNEGYIGQSCDCICRPGTSGPNCKRVEYEDYYGHLLSPCSEDIHRETTIQAPINENGYVAYDTWCTWRIMAPKDHIIRLTFKRFNLPITRRNCDAAFLEIRQKNQDFGDVYCGLELEPGDSIRSWDNELYLYLDVRNHISLGFSAQVSFVPGFQELPPLASSQSSPSPSFVVMGVVLVYYYLTYICRCF